MSQIDRFDIDMDGTEERCDDGRWVRFEDADAAIAAAQERIRYLKDWAEKRTAALAEHNRAVRAEERERIRLELLTEAEKWAESAKRLGDYDQGGCDALRDFARRLEGV